MYRPSVKSSRVRDSAFWFSRRPDLVVAIGVIVVALLWALAPELFTSIDPIKAVPGDTFQPPGPGHPFGTDNLGRDLYARVVFGARTSLSAVAIALAIAFACGALIGLVSGFVGGRVDDVLMRVIDILLAVPGLLISLLLVTALGFGMVNVAIAVGVAGVALFARVMRSEVLRVRNSAYIEAALMGGERLPAILFRYVLPNAIGPIVALAAVEFGSAILSISALSFLGFGAPPPAPEWGALVASGRSYLSYAWWLTSVPGLTILLVVLSANRIGRALDGERRNN